MLTKRPNINFGLGGDIQKRKQISVRQIAADINRANYNSWDQFIAQFTCSLND